MTRTMERVVYADDSGDGASNLTGLTNDPRQTQRRGAGTALIACALASVALLASHPDGGGSPAFADVLRREAAQAIPDAVVHGGFVLVLSVELIGFADLAVRADARRTSVLSAMLMAFLGVGFLSASMIIDGLITPAIAARYATAPAEAQELARALFVLIGAAIRFLMPLGLAFLGASSLAWGVALTRSSSRAGAVGVIALVLGATILAASGLSLQATSPYPVMIALMAQAAWVLVAGVSLLGWRSKSTLSNAARGDPRASPL